MFISCTVDGSFSVSSDRLDLCSELIQHLATSLNVNQLAAEVRMSEEQLKQLMNLFQQAKDLQNSRQRLTADIADHVISFGLSSRFNLTLNKFLTSKINGIHNFLAVAEDARMLHNLNEMRRAYAAIYSSNQSILSQSQLRNANYQQLMNCLKQVNVHVQQTAKCRGCVFNSIKCEMN